MYKAIKYYVGGVEQVIHTLYGVVVTEEFLDKVRAKNELAGYNERMVGYYDKWYRYNTFDNGASYDKGVRRAIAEGAVGDCTIIECMQ